MSGLFRESPPPQMRLVCMLCGVSEGDAEATPSHGVCIACVPAYRERMGLPAVPPPFIPPDDKENRAVLLRRTTDIRLLCDELVLWSQQGTMDYAEVLGKIGSITELAQDMAKPLVESLERVR